MRKKLLLLSLVLTFLFTYFSYTVAKEAWQKTDFDTTVKLQDLISRKYDDSTLLSLKEQRNQRVDEVFSYFSLFGSAEITISFCLLMVLFSFLRKQWLAIVGWLMIVPASVAEVFGKLVVFHPGPPLFFHRSVLPTNLPTFYIHTNFSYPSGHMTRTIFIVTVFLCIVFFSSRNKLFKLPIIAGLLFLSVMMGLTRVYLGEHWLSDVLGGGLLGAAAGLFASGLILRSKKV